MIERLEIGICECIYEPRGDCGLEGYQRGDKYIFEFMFCSRLIDKKYYRVYPAGIDYFETCGKIMFKRYFKKEVNK